jgi:hypothetical protein
MSPAAAKLSLEKWIATGRIPAAAVSGLEWIAEHEPADIGRAIQAAATPPASTTTTATAGTLTALEKTIARRMGVTDDAFLASKGKVRP